MEKITVVVQIPAPRKEMFKDLGKATLRGVRKCPGCGVRNGVCSLVCKNKSCGMVLRGDGCKKKKKRKSRAAWTADAVQIITGSTTQVFSVRMRDRGPDYRGFVELLSVPLESSLIVQTARCDVPTCQKHVELPFIDENDACIHIQRGLKCKTKATPLALNNSVLNTLPISDEMKQAIRKLDRDTTGPLVQRVSENVMVVKCNGQMRPKLGFLHLMFPKSKGTRPMYTRVLCPCRNFKLAKKYTLSYADAQGQPCVHYYAALAAFLSDDAHSKEFEQCIHFPPGGSGSLASVKSEPKEKDGMNDEDQPETKGDSAEEVDEVKIKPGTLDHSPDDRCEDGRTGDCGEDSSKCLLRKCMQEGAGEDESQCTSYMTTSDTAGKSEEHETLHTASKSSSCQIVQKSFVLVTGSDNHGKKVQRYQCKLCDKTVSSCHRMRHMRVHRSSRCEYCGKLFNKPATLKKHVMMVHRQYQCEHCGELFSRAGTLKQHSTIHTGEKPYQCEYCGKLFTRAAHMRQHRMVHTGERPYRCEHCQKAFTNKRGLKEHKRLHTGEKIFQCKYCEKTFAQVWGMKRHMIVHTGDGSYKCEYCEKTYINSYNWKVHMKVHREGKPHLCDYCDQAFSQAGGLRVHMMRVHTGERPYQCEYCEKAFAVGGALKIHVKRVH